jgi:arogenate dehydrogenase (NADP+), plant
MGHQHLFLRLAVVWSFALAFSAKMSHSTNARNADFQDENGVGRLESLKQQEAELARQLAAIRREKMDVLRSKPLSIGIIGFGRFGQFIAKTFSKYGRVVVTSRSDYTEIADSMGAKYVPLSDPDSFLKENLDVVVVAVSILSFRSTVEELSEALRRTTSRPLIVDVLSVKEHPRNIMLEYLPEDCDILCTHPMFGPDSGKNGWTNLNFVYEKTRLNGVVQQPTAPSAVVDGAGPPSEAINAAPASRDPDSCAEGIDRMERFLSIWEEEGCRMVQLACSAHDTFAANSQFITHLVGRVLGSQG